MRHSRSVLSFEYGVFDNDGTLVDTLPYCAGLFADAVAPYGVPRADAERYYAETTGMPMREQYRGVLAAHGIALRDEEIERVRKDFDAAFLKLDVRFFPHARRMLARLRRKGLTLFLSSAASDACVWKRLNAGGATKHFTLAYGSTAVPKGRRHLEIFSEVARKDLAEFAAKAFFCGDGETDMEIARTNGLYAIGVRGTVSDARLRAAGAQRLVTTVAEFLCDPAERAP
ncbi:MAG TPA: HAD hydrolase-like protein [Candidatus Binatia bacterium]|jgi:phosphoglycolate phosphatase-like HAD superfamily hydrolase|nr:HAD hydrolase-like protein [Candidatus Binatia bacterium]